MLENYEALGQNIFVKEIKEEAKVGGFTMPENLDVDFTKGEVVLCSTGYYDHGMFIGLQFAVGDRVLFPKVSGTKVTLGGEKVIRVFASDIVAKEFRKGE